MNTDTGPGFITRVIENSSSDFKLFYASPHTYYQMCSNRELDGKKIGLNLRDLLRIKGQITE